MGKRKPWTFWLRY